MKSVHPAETEQSAEPKTPDIKLVYPYIAGDARKTQIIAACSQIKAGMSFEQAREIAGDADEIRVLYEPKKINARPIGHTHWYYLEIECEGELIDAALMRISVDHDGMVMRVDHWGFDLPPGNGTQ